MEQKKEKISKSVWILNHYAVTPDMSGGTRHYDLSKELIEKGHNVTIFSSGFSHKGKKYIKLKPGELYKDENYEGVRFIWVNTIPYYRNNWKRLLNMVSYSIRVLNISKQVKKPDVIIGSSVHPFAVMSAWWLARRYKARFIFEVRDLWPQTPVEMGTIKPNSIEARLLYGWEKFMYKKTERIVVLMPNASKYIGNLGINEEKITWIPNGVNLSYFDKNDDDWESDILKTIKKNGNLFKVIYAGAHGPANGLDVVIEAAEILEKEDKDIHFFMVGDGVDKKRLMQKAEEMGMTNITFLGEVEKLQIPMVLKSSDVLLHCLKKLNVFKYGISPNKLNDYMASSKPIIMSANTSNNIIKEANAGLTVEPENPQELAKAIIKIKKMVPEERKKFGENGRKYIEEYYNIKKLADKLESIL